jgi:hypothetical protein
LVTAGAAIGNAVALEVKGGWIERASIWALTVARSGDGKSPAHAVAVKPMQTRETALHRAFRDELEAWKAAPPEGRGPKPRAEHAAVTDATMEALANALLTSPRGLLMPLDEATAWVMGMNAYRGGKGGADRPHWLAIWGSEPTTIIRATRDEAIHLPASFVAVSGNIPPDKLSTLNDEHGAEDGFLARILFSYPLPLQATASDAEVSREQIEAWDGVIARLLRLTPRADGNGQTGVPMLPAVADFTADGRRAWHEFAKLHAAELYAEDFPDTWRAPWS